MRDWQLGAMNAIMPIMDHPTRILIVDDDAGIRRLISSFLDKHGFRTETAGHPIEMRENVAEEPYDLNVLDRIMPTQAGLAG